MELNDLRTIRRLAESFDRKELSPVDVTKKTLSSIDADRENLNCFITVLHGSALREAEESARRYEKGVQLGPLDGIPVAIKDLIYVAGVRCTAGSKILSQNVAPYDAPAVARLKKAGAVLVGTTNMHEFASGITGENPHFGAVRNPWDTTRISGGSSSGSAAAVSSGLSVAALGTDTAGSVRTPAALCGVVGFKPTYGRVSRLGVIPLASSFDTVGTLTSSAWDSAALLEVLAGHEAEDLTTVDAPVPKYLDEIDKFNGGVSVGVPRRPFSVGNEPGVEAVFEQLLDNLRSIGCTLRDIELKGMEAVQSCWETIRYAESSAFHMKWLQESPESYGADVRASLERGKKIMAVDYVNAQNMRPGLMQDFSSSMSDLDVIAIPTTSIVAPKLGEETVVVGGEAMQVRTALIRHTLPFNVVGFPSISVPAGLHRNLPVGVQLVAGPFNEAVLLRVAFALEKKFPFPERPRTL